jgi:ABC-type lipoprotein release transport system permease subunit
MTGKMLPFDLFIEPVDRKRIETALEGKRWTPRVTLSAELYFNEDFFAVPGSIQTALTAVDPERDGTVLRVAEKVDQGRWLRAGDTGVVIGSWLAEDIGAKPDIVITVECKGRGGFLPDVRRGNSRDRDDGKSRRQPERSVMDLGAADGLLALDGAVTEYTVRAGGDKHADTTVALLRNAAPGVDPRSWEEVAHDEILLTKAKSSGSKLYIFFIFIIAAVGISNTMLMAVMERKNEIGMLRALGYGNFSIRWQFLLEGFWIGLIGSAMGLVGGLLADLYMVSYGIDFSFMLRDMDVGYRITGIMRSAWNPQGIVASIFGAVAISTFVAWFPSGKILKKEVADILRS